jgi:hypothetical protein
MLRRVQLQSQIVKLEALRAAHLDGQVQARWELKRLPQRIAELEARLQVISLDVAYRSAHAPTNSSGERVFAIAVALEHPGQLPILFEWSCEIFVTS